MLAMKVESYAVVLPPSAWLRLGRPPAGLVERVWAALERIALEATAHPARGYGLATLRTDDGYAAFVTLDHQARTVTLGEVGHVGTGGCIRW
jgi:hypothetical protein